MEDRFRNEFNNDIKLTGKTVDDKLVNYKMFGPDSVSDQTITRMEAKKLRDLLDKILSEKEMNKQASFIENRKEDLDQLDYLLKHKKDVYQSGRELGAPRLQLIKHDWSKFKPSNWTPYREYFFGEDGFYENNKSREGIPAKVTEDFREAARDHLSAEDHHMHKRPSPEESVELRKVPVNIRKEMLSDWHSVSKRTSEDPKEFPDVKTWAKKNNMDWMYKDASYLAHSTNEDSLNKILTSGQIKAISHLAADDPNNTISVEGRSHSNRRRKNLKTREALEKLKGSGRENKIFFTRNGYEKGYGDYVILKKYKDYKPHDKFTFIPNEVVVNEPVSIKEDAAIFAPKERVKELSKKYPSYMIRSKEALPVKEFTVKDKLQKVVESLKEKFASADPLNEAVLTGSKALGLNLKDKSDNDLLVKADDYEDAIDKALKLLKKYPKFRASAYNDPSRNKIVFQGEIEGIDTDVVFNWSDDYDTIVKAFEDANQILTDSQREAIRQKKRELKNAFFFPETRYKRYKMKKNKELGVYF